MIPNPSQLGFRMPAEWEPHSALWLAWPHDKISFPNRIKKAEAVFVHLIQALHESERINLLVLDDAMQQRIIPLLEKKLINLKKIQFYKTNYADIWTRDYGPTFISNSDARELAWVKWNYNAYGNKFPDLLKDNEIFLSLRGNISSRMFEPGINMEGGAIEVNGKGTLITTEQCLLNPNRNPNLSKKQIEGHLKNNLGVTKIIWLKEGIMNDHTDGHIDDMVKFVSPNKVLLAYEDNENDANFSILETNNNILQNSTNQDDLPLEIIKLPMPHMNYDNGEQAPASYANFYIGNETVIVPKYKDPNDAKALEIIQSCFPDRKVVGIDCTDIIYGGGAIHCMTQQVPS